MRRAGLWLTSSLVLACGDTPPPAGIGSAQQAVHGPTIATATATATATAAAAPAAATPSGSAVAFPGVEEQLRSAGRARVIVNLHDPVDIAAPLTTRLAAIAVAQDDVLARLPPSSFDVIRRYQVVPALAGILLPAALPPLLAAPGVASVQLDEPSAFHLAEAVPAIHGDIVRNQLGVKGAGVNVAIIDTGVDLNHPDVGPAVVGQQCFTFFACAPNNTTQSANAQDQNGHGTNVAGVVTSDGVRAPIGFAPSAGIVAVRTLDANGSGFLSDWVSGLDWIRANLGVLKVRVINLSLGSNTLYNGTCDGAQPSVTNAVAQLVVQNVAVFASSGNAGSASQTASPACNTGVISVGATYDAPLNRQPANGTYNDLFGGTWPACFDANATIDTITCFTNSSSKVSIVAPGARITSAGLGGGTSTYIGTSQASPSAAGVAALMIETFPGFSPAALEAALRASGPMLVDAKNNLKIPRIDALAAVQAAQQLACTGQPNGTPCDDGDACTKLDTCMGGTCKGANPVQCAALDQCHDAGVCDPKSGVCSNPAKADGAACSDGNACTVKDTCKSGACVAGAALVCAALDACHDAGTCSPQSGLCSNPAKADGASCSDGSPCTIKDTCKAGACIAGAAVVCVALDQCHDAGVCDPQSGSCSNPVKADGAACSDGIACTLKDTCKAGACLAGASVVCIALDPCHDAGACDPQSGLCTNPAKLDGAPCSDGNACTLKDACKAGTCLPGAPVACAALDACHDAGACDPLSGRCSNPSKPDGAACSDGNACTMNDLCQGGACVAGAPVVCLALDPCHDAGACDPRSGVCSHPDKPDGAGCSDGDACTRGDSCRAGVCVGGAPTTCGVSDDCHAAGVCDPTTGACSNPVQGNGASCDDHDPCTRADVCTGGRCGGTAYRCQPTACQASSTCDGKGGCTAANKEDGTSCDDGNRCTAADRCQAGVCQPGAPLDCAPADACHLAGACDPATGGCSNPAAPDGTACPQGTCMGGACVASPSSGCSCDVGGGSRRPPWAALGIALAAILRLRRRRSATG